MADHSASLHPEDKAPDSDGEPMTPSDHSDAEHEDDSGDSDREDSDYQSEDGTGDSSNEDGDKPNIKWTGYNKKVPVIMFHSEAVLQNVTKYKKVGERFHMAFKFGSTESRIIRTVLLAHGFHEVSSNNSDFNMLWTGGHLKPLTLRNMSEFQKINHFPRSYELTRKDRLYKNVQRMQQIKGSRNFNFVPMSFVIPAEYQEFCSSFSKDKGPWIIKPVASSRGRGVHLITSPDQVPLEENLIISRYIQNPLLIDGFKFDVRLYVAVTSYDPLVVYLYEEGLTRFATVRYEKSHRNLRNQCMHLTNYSVNKKSNGYVKNDDPDIEDYGNKWSLGALLRYLKRQGTDTAALMMKIEDVIVKTILSAELHIAAATKMFVNNKWNCFELYGFDILIDDTMKPWILEVNLSPSLVCDSPLDLKIKTNLVCDLFSAIGIVCHDPILKNYQQTRKNREFAAQMNCSRNKRRPASAGASTSSSHGNRTSYFRRGMSGLNSEEIKIVRRIKEEEARKGGWVRLFPSPDSWDLYSPFLQFSTTHNLMLHQRLYPHRHKAMMYKCLTPVTSLGSRAKMVYNNLANSVSNLSKFENENCESFVHAQRRALQYERRLEDRRVRPKKPRRGRTRRAKKSKSPTEAVPNHSILTEKLAAAAAASSSSSSTTKPFFYSSLDGLDKVSSSYSSISRSCPSPIAGGSAYGSQASNEYPHLLDYSNSLYSRQFDAKAPKVNMIEILEKGGNLSQLQARTAFALYLTQVQQRLMKEASSREEGNVDSLNDQMDLVLRFLKRAAVNLQRNFRVIVPSKKLPLKERARILAKELAEFVQHYKKETQQLKKTLSNEMKDEITQPISSEDFNRFLQYSNESELEMVLTTYAKLKKSASIFLGESTASTLDDSQSSSISTSSTKEGKGSAKKEGTHRGKKNTSPPKTSRTSTSRPSSSSSRGLSAAIQDVSVDTYNEKAIQDALQNLMVKQQLRQYSAHKGTGVPSSRTCDSKQSALSLNSRSKSLDRKASKSCRVPNASSMSNISTQENLYVGLGKSISDSITTTTTTTGRHKHSQEVCSNGTQSKPCSTPVCNLNSPELETQNDGAFLSLKTLISPLDATLSDGASSQISAPPSTASSVENPNNANNNNINSYSNKIKNSNDKVNRESSLQHIKKMVLPQAYPSSIPSSFTSVIRSHPNNRGGQSLRPASDPLHKRFSSEPYILPTAKTELSASTSAQRFFQQWTQQMLEHQQPQALQKQHKKKHPKLHQLGLQKTSPSPSPSFDLTVKQLQSVYAPRPPAHRPRKTTNLYKAYSCLIPPPNPNPKSGEQKTRRAASSSSYKTL